MKYVYNDGGRDAAGYNGNAGDCVTRAIAIATGRPYTEIYAMIAEGCGSERKSKRTRTKGRTARNGVYTNKKWFKDLMTKLGFRWTPTMTIGSGCTVHLKDGELPMGRLIASVSKHYCAIIDGVIHDTHDPNQRAGTIYPPDYTGPMPKGARWLENGNGWYYAPDRCVYGYWLL
jgi:hypothetical protein